MYLELNRPNVCGSFQGLQNSVIITGQESNNELFFILCPKKELQVYLYGQICHNTRLLGFETGIYMYCTCKRTKVCEGSKYHDCLEVLSKLTASDRENCLVKRRNRSPGLK